MNRRHKWRSVAQVSLVSMTKVEVVRFTSPLTVRLYSAVYGVIRRVASKNVWFFLQLFFRIENLLELYSCVMTSFKICTHVWCRWLIDSFGWMHVVFSHAAPRPESAESLRKITNSSEYDRVLLISTIKNTTTTNSWRDYKSKNS